MIPELMIGDVLVSVILTIILGIVYNLVIIPDRAKSGLAVLIGTALGIVAMYFNLEPPFSVKMYIQYGLQGFMIGAAAVGLYENYRMVRRPRA